MPVIAKATRVTDHTSIVSYRPILDCKTVVFFANASYGPYSNERSGASEKTARENGERLARFTLEDHAYGATAFRNHPKTTVLQSNQIYTNTPEKVIKAGTCLGDVSDYLPVLYYGYHFKYF